MIIEGADFSVQLLVLESKFTNSKNVDVLLPFIHAFPEVNHRSAAIASRIKNTSAKLVKKTAPVTCGGENEVVSLHGYKQGC